MKKMIFAAGPIGSHSARLSAALAVLRVVVGIGFLFHGYGKILSPFGWMGPDAPVPGLFQALAALAEFGGGIALILGLMTPLASLGLIATMAVAVQFHIGKGDSFVGGYELALQYLAASMVLWVAGPGRYSLDYLILGRNQEGREVRISSRVAELGA